MKLEDRFETTDGSSPVARPLDAALGAKWPIGAFTLLSGGDVFESVGGKPPPDGVRRAEAYVKANVVLHRNGAPGRQVGSVCKIIASQVSANLPLIARLTETKPISVDLIPPGAPMHQFGFPAAVSRSASGLFWDDPAWPEARMALRQEHLDAEPQLVIHEMAHAIMHMAFTAEERELIYRAMMRTYRSRRAVDEVFAIYSEREFVTDFTGHELEAPGVYGMARQRWSEEHLFTRFVRYLYFPHRPLAGPGAPKPPPVQLR